MPVLKNDKFHNEFGKMIPQYYQNKLLTKDLRAAPKRIRVYIIKNQNTNGSRQRLQHQILDLHMIFRCVTNPI